MTTEELEKQLHLHQNGQAEILRNIGKAEEQVSKAQQLLRESQQRSLIQSGSIATLRALIKMEQVANCTPDACETNNSGET